MIERAGNSNSLPLATGEADATVADDRLQSLRLRFDDVLQSSELDRFSHLLDIDPIIRNAKCDVSRNRIIADIETLWNVPDIPPPSRYVLANVSIIDPNCACIVRIHPANQYYVI